jgi:3'-phosphoadenosine 5'-phosphosulfate sulfotransferase (PAPS reductase)/FAD synthetase
MGNNKKYIVSFSGGKDSTAMLLLLLEQNKRIDEVVYFDAESWEFPEMHEHINKVEQYTGLKITRLKAKRNFDYFFSDHIITKGKAKGQIGYGFPSATRRWCTREKIRTINKYIKDAEVVYIGYAFDEQNRIKKEETKAEPIYPLIDAKITEKEALQMCYNNGFDWGGLYEVFKRVSCWCCPLQPNSELKKLYDFKPELWRKLQQMQDVSINTFRMNYKRIEDYTNEYTKQLK